LIPVTLKTWEILDEVALERASQDAKWGEQNHPTGQLPLYRETLAQPKEAQAECEWQRDKGTMTWADIAVEELSEAVYERDDAKRRAELIQVAAVAVAWIECMDRKTGR